MAALSPDELATLEAKYKANQSPAAQSAGVDSFNAVSRMRSALPGVGAPGSTTLTDATNLATAGAMDRADLGNRFGFGSPEYAQNSESPVTPAQDSGIDIGAVHERRNQILQGIDPDAPARYVSDVAPKGGGISRKAQLQHELGVLTGIAHQHALETAQGAHEDFVKQKTIDTGNQVAGFFTDLGASKTKLGTPEHTQEVNGLAAKYPLALGTAGVRDALKTHLAQHIAASNFVTPEGTQLARVVQTSDGKSQAVFTPIPAITAYESKEALLKENPDAKPKQNAKGGWYDTGDKTSTDVTKTLQSEAKNTYGVQLSQIQKPLSVRSGNLDEKGNFVPANGGNAFQVDVLDKGKAGSKKTITIPREDYVRFGGTMSEADKSLITKQSATTATTAPATPEDIRAQYKSGKLTKDQATALLKKGHGFE